MAERAGVAGRDHAWFVLFRALDAVLRVVEPMFPRKLRQRAIDAALSFIEERLNGEDGMGAIYPPMANLVMMYDALGKDENYPPRAVTRKAIDRLLVVREEEAYCQPCVSPVWDTALTCHAMTEAGSDAAISSVKKGLDWLLPKQVLDLKGDWAVKRPDVRPGGWAFQYNNAYYPDLDDTAVVVMFTSTTSRSRIMARCSIRRPRTSPAAVSRCWRSLARPSRTAGWSPPGSSTCEGRSSRTAPGMAAGA